MGAKKTRRGPVLARCWVLRDRWNGADQWFGGNLASARQTVEVGWQSRRTDALEFGSKVEAFRMARNVGGKVYRRGHRARVMPDGSFIVPCNMEGINLLANAMFAWRKR